MKHIPSVASLCFAFWLVQSGSPHWGWFLFLAVVLA